VSCSETASRWRVGQAAANRLTGSEYWLQWRAKNEQMNQVCRPTFTAPPALHFDVEEACRGNPVEQDRTASRNAAGTESSDRACGEFLTRSTHPKLDPRICASLPFTSSVGGLLGPRRNHQPSRIHLDSGGIHGRRFVCVHGQAVCP